jgi:hypothetical protein
MADTELHSSATPATIHELIVASPRGRAGGAAGADLPGSSIGTPTEL